jgi:hypothetical protein
MREPEAVAVRPEVELAASWAVRVPVAVPVRLAVLLLASWAVRVAVATAVNPLLELEASETGVTTGTVSNARKPTASILEIASFRLTVTPLLVNPMSWPEPTRSRALSSPPTAPPTQPAMARLVKSLS